MSSFFTNNNNNNKNNQEQTQHGSTIRKESKATTTTNDGNDNDDITRKLREELQETKKELAKLKQQQQQTTTTTTTTNSSKNNINNNNKNGADDGYAAASSSPKLLLIDDDKDYNSNNNGFFNNIDINDNNDMLGATIHLPTGKRGYLFKWLDRTIGWGGTKWALRFVSLEPGRLVYYGSHTDTSPRYVLSLRGCAVRDDGWKRNRRHNKSSSYYNNNKQKNQNNNNNKNYNPPLDEVGAYFFLFSIYQRGPGAAAAVEQQQQQQYGKHNAATTPDNDNMITISAEDDDCIPILRFSTPSLGEKMLWIQRIAESCAFAETDTFLDEERERSIEMDKQRQQQLNMSMAMPEAKEGTLPPLFFMSPPSSSSKHEHHHHATRRPSLSRIPSSKLFRTKSKSGDVDKLEAKSKKGYPPSKPMHRTAGPSYLSADAPIQNYRGFFNLGIIVLVVSNIRLLQSTIQKHGFAFAMDRIVNYIRDLQHVFNSDPWEEFPFLSGFVLQLVFVGIGFCIEWSLSRRNILSESVGMILHHINAHSALLIPALIVWNHIDNPPIGGALLMQATITWMKLLSYLHANQDYRETTIYYNTNSKDGSGGSGGGGSNAGTTTSAALVIVENLDQNDENVTYPMNVTLKNIYYFWFCPTLTYQIAYPKAPKRRIWKIIGYIMQMVVCFTLFTFLAAQLVTPTLDNLLNDLEETNGTYTVTIIAEYLLKLAIANTYMWLLMFYTFFHLYLNLLGEILRFGDRVFYKDWWNSSEVGSYWRLWNLPVHYWMVRHIYFPCIRLNMFGGKTTATFIVFFFSAIMHEVLVSVPFHMIRPWSFIGMMMQMPLAFITKYLSRKYPGSSIGNFIFWISFCVVGQPMAILLYTIDWKYGHKNENTADPIMMNMQQDNEYQDTCRIALQDFCVIR